MVADLQHDLLRDEGLVLTPYKDSLGLWTVGVGHCFDRKPLSKAACLFILGEDIDDVLKDLDASIPWWRGLDEVRQRVLANMCFQLGIAGLMQFRQTIEAIKAGDYNEAAKLMLVSLWAKQTPSRAVRMSNAMASGEMH